MRWRRQREKEEDATDAEEEGSDGGRGGISCATDREDGNNMETQTELEKNTRKKENAKLSKKKTKTKRKTKSKTPTAIPFSPSSSSSSVGQLVALSRLFVRLLFQAAKSPFTWTAIFAQVRRQERLYVCTHPCILHSRIATHMGRETDSCAKSYFQMERSLLVRSLHPRTYVFSSPPPHLPL